MPSCTTEPIEVVMIVTDIDDVIQNYDVLKVYRSTSGEGGPYAEITCQTTRVPLQAGVTRYTYEDGAGSKSYWYRFSYFNSDTLAESAQSDPEPGELHPALQVISVTELKTIYMFGLDLTDDAGRPYPDSLFAHYIKSAVSSLEHRLDLPIKKTVVEYEAHDYYREDYDKYIWLETDYYPVIGVDEVKLVLPGEEVVQIFNQDWIRIRRQEGHIQIVPGPGVAGSVLFGARGTWIPLIYSHNKMLPDAFRLKYTAGFGYPEPGQASHADPKLNEQADVIKDMVGKLASFGPLNIAGDLLGGAGIASQSIGIDGLSQSFNTTSSSTSAGYGARLIQYAKELKENYKMLKDYYKGIRMKVA
jgi:hypothetical protein